MGRVHPFLEQRVHNSDMRSHKEERVLERRLEQHCGGAPGGRHHHPVLVRVEVGNVTVAGICVVERELRTALSVVFEGTGQTERSREEGEVECGVQQVPGEEEQVRGRYEEDQGRRGREDKEGG